MVVVIITGPPGSGKSTVTTRLAKIVPNSAVINVDFLRQSIINGYVNPWEKEGKVQADLAIDNACSLANNFVKAGFNVFIDHVITRKERIDELKKRISGVKFFVLLPSKETVIARDSGRKEDEIMGKRAVELYDEFKSVRNDWTIIDSTNQSIDDTVKMIKELSFRQS